MNILCKILGHSYSVVSVGGLLHCKRCAKRNPKFEMPERERPCRILISLKLWSH